MTAWALIWAVSGHKMRNFFTCKPGSRINPGNTKQTKFNYATVANRKPLHQDVKPLLQQVSLAWENPIHLPGHSLQAPALGSAWVSPRSLPIATQTCLYDAPATPNRIRQGYRPGASNGAENCPRGVREAQGPSAPPCTLGTHAAGRPAPAQAGEPGVRRAGPATRLCLARSQRLPAVPSGRSAEPGPKVPQYALDWDLATRLLARPADNPHHLSTASSVSRAVS